MPAGDLYMISFKQTYGTGGKPCDNSFSYYGETGSPTAVQLLDSFVTEMLPLINGIQTDTMKNLSIRVINLFSVTDFAEDTLSGTGTTFGANADTLPSHDVQRYTLRLSRRDINPGSKRFSGIAEGAAQNGVITDSNQLTDVEALRIGLGTTLASEGVNFMPIVIKRIVMPPDEDHPKTWYRLPTNAGEADYGDVLSVSANVIVGTQTSRKR